MSTAIETRRGRGRPKLPPEEVMPQIAVRIPRWILDAIDEVIQAERYGESERAMMIRELLAESLARRGHKPPPRDRS